MNYLTISSIFYNEAPNMAEWIAHHLNMGVEHFYLWNHASGDNWREAIRLFRRVVTITNAPENNFWPHRFVEADAMLERTSYWVAHIDFDEYLIPDEKSVIETLQASEKADALGVHWLMFGTSGHIERPRDLTVSAYHWRPNALFGANAHIKSIVKPKSTNKYSNPHILLGKNTINTIGEQVPSANTGKITHQNLRLNHYFTRSRQEWEQKVARGGGDGTRRNINEIDAYDLRDISDTRASKYAADIQNTLIEAMHGKYK